jgi:hypothetical protein
VGDGTTKESPGRAALRSWPIAVRAKASALLVAIAAAPPYRFSGGGYWEAMSDEMAGIYELRVDGDARRHYRLFCVLDTKAQGADKPYLAVIQGMDKQFRSTFSAAQYRGVQELRDEYLARNPRSLYRGQAEGVTLIGVRRDD